ncbi:MAG: 4Fe-4S binding protein [Chloroflexi bacterium]|nr:4Fe-4S binding protein [Chloroflexota bacterium]
MPKRALVDFELCQPGWCGVCAAAAACRRRLIWQESPGEPPMPDPSLCRGCGDCARACPFAAIEVRQH